MYTSSESRLDSDECSKIALIIDVRMFAYVDTSESGEEASHGAARVSVSRAISTFGPASRVEATRTLFDFDLPLRALGQRPWLSSQSSQRVPTGRQIVYIKAL